MSRYIHLFLNIVLLSFLYFKTSPCFGHLKVGFCNFLSSGCPNVHKGSSSGLKPCCSGTNQDQEEGAHLSSVSFPALATYKIVLLAFKALNGNESSYLEELMVSYYL